jgi:hypothetical protein
MKPRTILLILATALLASCAYTLPNGGASVEASNGLFRGTNGAPIITMAAAGPVNSNPTAALAAERARKAEAFNNLPK